MLTIQYIFCGFFLSLLGSIPIGMITLMIVDRTISHGAKAGVSVGLGASIAEFVYTVVALKFVQLLLMYHQISEGIKMASLVIFLVLSIYYFFIKGRNTPNMARSLKKATPNHFMAGVLIGFLNMLIIPFWVVMGAVVEERGLPLKDYQAILVFSFAATLGALVVFVGYVRLSKLIINKMQWAIKYTDRAVGIVFLGLTVFQLMNILS